MLVLRTFGALLMIALVGYVLTKDRRWLRFIARTLVIGLLLR
jgi:hypothetical protein